MTALDVEMERDMGAFPKLGERDMLSLEGMAERCEFGEGEILFKAGKAEVDLFVVVSGQVEILNPSDGNRRIVMHGPGEFTGDIDVLTGRPVIVTAVARGERTEV